MLELHIGEEKIPVIFGNDDELQKTLAEKGIQPVVVNPPSALPVFFPSPDLTAVHDIKYHETSPTAQVIELTPEVTTYHGERVQRLHDKTLELLHLVLPDVVWPVDGSKRSYVLRHLLGLIDLTLKLSDSSTASRITIVWKRPEDGLHPKHQASLGDVVIRVQEYLTSDKNS